MAVSMCRFVDNGKARPMKGYIVEIDPEIETSLSTVMPGVKWSTWKPVFLPETDSLVETWTETVMDYLVSDGTMKVSSKTLKKLIKADTIAPRTWARIIKQVLSPTCQASNKKEHVRDGMMGWALVGSTLVKKTAESFGFKAA